LQWRLTAQRSRAQTWQFFSATLTLERLMLQSATIEVQQVQHWTGASWVDSLLDGKHLKKFSAKLLSKV